MLPRTPCGLPTKPISTRSSRIAPVIYSKNSCSDRRSFAVFFLLFFRGLFGRRLFSGLLSRSGVVCRCLLATIRRLSGFCVLFGRCLIRGLLLSTSGLSEIGRASFIVIVCVLVFFASVFV